MNSNKYYMYLGLLCSFCMLQTGCSISYSLEQSSDSVSASLESLTSPSRSSSGEEEAQVSATATIYEEDVAAATVLYVSSDKNNDTYLRQITSIAENHGISDWEQESSTFFGMGKGLRRAGVAESSIASLPYFRSIADSPNYSLVLRGYQM